MALSALFAEDRELSRRSRGANIRRAIISPGPGRQRQTQPHSLRVDRGVAVGQRTKRGNDADRRRLGDEGQRRRIPVRRQRFRNGSMLGLRPSRPAPSRHGRGTPHDRKPRCAARFRDLVGRGRAVRDTADRAIARGRLKHCRRCDGRIVPEVQSFFGLKTAVKSRSLRVPNERTSAT